MNFSLLVIVVLMFFTELSLPPETNIRLDLLLLIPTVIMQGIVYLVFTFIVNKGEKN